MNLALFTRLLDTHGADFRRWPEALRAAGEAFRDASPEAFERWTDATRLDALFALDREEAIDPARQRALVDAGLRRIRNRPARQGFDWRWLFSKPIGAGLAAATLAGFAAGLVFGPALQPREPQGEAAIAFLLGYTPGDLDGLL